MAKLSYLGHVLTENRHGLVVDVELSEANGRTAREAALHMVERSDRDRLRRLLVAALQDALHAESPGARPEERRGAGRDDGAHDLPAALGGRVHAQHARVVEQLDDRFPEAAALLAEAAPDVLAFTACPVAHWKQVWSNNPQERLL